MEMFEEIGQVSSDLDLDLMSEVEGLDIIDVQDQPGFEYPAMLISGIQFNDVLRILKAVDRKSYRSFDVWIDLGEGIAPVKQGTLPMDSRVLLTAKYLGLNITLYLDVNNVQTLDLNNPEVIACYI